MTNQSRQEIIHQNFFFYLEKSGKTMSEYAKENDLDRTILSKWKSMSSNMNAEHIYQAAKYFNVVANDLYYSKSEKKNLEVLTDINYHPILAQQSVKIKNYKRAFKNPLIYIGLTVFLSIITTAFLFLTIKFSLLSLIVMLASLIFLPVYLEFNVITRKHLIINYTDEIIYLRKDEKNKNKKSSLIIISLNIIFTFISILLLKDIELNQSIISIYALLSLCIILLHIYSLIFYPSKLPLKSHGDFGGYYHAVFRFLLICFSFSLVLIIYLNFQAISFIALIIGLLSVLMAALDFISISKTYNDYELAYVNSQNKIEYLKNI